MNLGGNTGSGANSTLCRYGKNCRRPGCTFTHPIPSTDATPVRLDDSNHVKTDTSKGDRSKANKKTCKFGENCRRPGCTFTHPIPPEDAAPVRLDDNSELQTDTSKDKCSGANSTLCRYGENCRRSGCTFTHPTAPNDAATVRLDDSNHVKTDTLKGYRSKANEKACKFGENCRRSGCTFTHPTLPKDPAPDIEKIVETINLLFLQAEQLQGDINTDIEELDNNLHDCTVDTLQQHKLAELSLQRAEYQLAVDRIRVQYEELVKSTQHNSCDVAQFEQVQKQLERELKRGRSRLPIYAKRSDIITKLRRSQVLILKADTGSGKSTQTVQYLCDEHFADKKQIICTQPRKLAARSLAVRVAEEYGCQIGEDVGFQVGGGGRPKTTQKTKIKFVTDTLFLNEYQNNPMLTQYSVIIIDEAHERKIDTDIVFGLMKKCLKERKDLKLVVMSATLDMDLIYDYFANDFRCETLEVGGRTYPIEDFYLDEDVENYVETSVAKAIEIHKSGEIGDILVFLTGQDEIDAALSELNKKLENDKSYIGMPLHGKLSEEENTKIFEKMPQKRKIIFSTNVAETSITIDGIKHVVESGMSSVKQRRGRAGRTSAGKCYHLYTVEAYEAMEPCSRAEILCTQPTIAILKLKALKIDNIESFEWLQPPSSISLREAHQMLIWLNGLDSNGRLTNLGRNMARLDIDPKLTAMFYKGKELNCLHHVLILAGMLTVSQNIWYSNKDQEAKNAATQARASFGHDSGDHITLINLYLKWTSFCVNHKTKKEQYEWCKSNAIMAKSLQIAQDFIKEKGKQMEYEVDVNILEELNDEKIDRIFQCITAGFFMNLAISNGSLKAGYQVVSTFPQTSDKPLSARVFRTSALCFQDQMPKFVFYNELLNLNGTNYITVLSSAKLDWLQSISKHWFNSINGANLNTMCYESFVFENIGSTLMRAIVGKRNCHLNQLEDMAKAIIDIDYKQSRMTVSSSIANMQMAKRIVKETIDKEKQKLLTEAEEIQIVGRTRILMGAGGITETVLLGDDYITIILTKLPTTITEERVQTLCEAFGTIRKINFIRQNENDSCVAVTYSTVDEARFAFAELNGYIEQGREISVSGSCVKTEAMANKQNCRLNAIWYLTPSTGNGRISFTRAESARNACELFQKLKYQCNYEYAGDLPALKFVFYLAKNSGIAYINFRSPEQAMNTMESMNHPQMTLAKAKTDRGASILYKEIPEGTDEEDLRVQFQNYDGFLEAQVLRGNRNTKVFERPASAVDDIKAIFNRYNSFQRDSVTFSPRIFNGKVEGTVRFLDVTDLKHAIEEMSGKVGYIGYGKVRLSEHTENKKDDKEKKKEDEYIVRFRNLDPSIDKYDLIKVLKENKLYDDLKTATVFREKFKKNSAETTTTDNTSEEELGLIGLRSMFLCQTGLFQSTPDIQISACAPDGTVTALVLFSDPSDVTTAIQTYENQVVTLFKGSSKLRLIPSISHEIYINAALTKAIPNKIKLAIQYVREKYRRIFIKVAINKTEKAPPTKIRIDGDDLNQINLAKIQFDNLMKGMEYTFQNDTAKTRLILDREGTKALQKIQDKTSSYIWWNYSNCFVRIYGEHDSCNEARKCIDDYIVNILENRRITENLDIPLGHVRQVFEKVKVYRESIGKTFNVEISPSALNRQLRVVGRRQDVENCVEAIKED